ncbi:MAG: DUF4372 domain-containing protein [Phycisphaerae bacterium]|nr:DUF4372 domain-containing protein [Phycisphaerae bacterium]
MYTGRIVFSQLMDFMPIRDFRCCVRRYRGAKSCKFSASRFSRKFLCIKHLQNSTTKTPPSDIVTNCHCSTSNRTVLIADFQLKPRATGTSLEYVRHAARGVRGNACLAGALASNL